MPSQSSSHLQRSTAALRSLHMAAYHFMLNVILALCAITLLLSGWITGNNSLLLFGSAVLVIWLLSIAIFYLFSLCWHCPLCLGKLWTNTGYRRHRNSKAALGISHRLTVASAVIFKAKYRCTYCGESFSSRKARH